MPPPLGIILHPTSRPDRLTLLPRSSSTSHATPHIQILQEEIRGVKGHFGPINALAFNSDGKVCLDGSPPAYHLSPGYGSGVNNWLVQIKDSPAITRTLNLASALEVGGGGATKAANDTLSKSCNSRLILIKAFQFGFENHLQDNVAAMAQQYFRSVVASM